MRECFNGMEKGEWRIESAEGVVTSGNNEKSGEATASSAVRRPP